MDKFTPQIAYRLEVPRNDASQTEIKFTAQSNFIAGLRIGEPYMSHPPPQKKELRISTNSAAVYYFTIY